MLVKGWVKKQSYYYTQWLEKGSPKENFTEEDHEGFCEDDDWLDWASALPLECAAFDKVLEFRKWRPLL